MLIDLNLHLGRKSNLCPIHVLSFDQESDYYLIFSGCGPNLQVYVADQGLEGLEPVRQSKVEGERRQRLHQNLEDWDRMHLEESQNIQQQQQKICLINRLMVG